MSFSLSAEAEHAKVAQRYQMVGDALRGELSDSSFIDVSQAVREALANEDIATEMSAVNTKASTDGVGNKKASTGFFDWSSLFRPAAGMATAALVAVVMVFSLSGKLSEQGNDDFSTNSVAAQETNPSMNSARMNNAAVAQPASTQQGQAQFRTVANVPSTQSGQINTLLNQDHVNPAYVNNKATKMSPYINQHLEFARQETLQGRMPYVRAVSFENKAQ
jgi:negative regulator of sigma E activity